MMKKLLKYGLIILLSLGLTSHSGAHENIAGKMMALMEESAETLEKLADGGEPADAVKKFEEISQQQKELKKKFKDLGEVSSDQEKVLKEKLADRKKAVQKRMGDALAKALKSGKITEEVQKALEDAMNSFKVAKSGKAEITLEAPKSVVAGAFVKIKWTGPANKGDYITIVTADTDDGKYAHYAYAKDPDDVLKVFAPLKAGKAEIRYMTEPGNKVLARREMTLTKAEITLEAPESAPAGSMVKIKWIGPANQGDYITIVTADTDDGEYAQYAYAKDPEELLKIAAPGKSGKAEIRYMTEQGNKVLSRRPITLTKAE